MKKVCSQCCLEKEISEFSKTYKKNVNGSIVGGGRRANCRLCENKRRKKSYDANPITRMFMNVKSRCKAKKIEFDLEIGDIIIPLVCPILKISFEIGTKTNYWRSPTIDRIDSTKGYIKGNVRVISMMANKMKSNATKEQCLTFAKNIEEYFN